MKSQLLLASILRGVWAMDPVAAQAHYPLLFNLMSGNIAESQQLEPKAYEPNLISASSRGLSNSSTGEKKFVQVIEQKGVVYKYDQYCGPRGTESLVRNLYDAGNDPNVVAVVIDVDTPGGEGGACQLPVQAIEEVSAIKPVIAYVGNGMCASAGYYYSSACDEIYATFKTDQIGSIGTYVTLADFKKHFEMKGISLHEIYATASTNKNRLFKEALNGEYDSILKNLIDPFNTEFANTVMSNRGIEKGSDALTGTLYFAEDAVKAGLIDGLLTYNQVIDRAFELAERPELNKRQERMQMNSPSTNTPGLVRQFFNKASDFLTLKTSNNQTENKMDLQKVKARIEGGADGAPIALSAEESADVLSLIEATGAEEKLFTQGEVDALVSTAVTAANDSKDEEIQTLSNEKVLLKARVDALVAKPAATTTVPNTATPKPSGEEKKEDEFSTSADAMLAKEMAENQ